MVFPVPEGISRTQCPPASSVSASGQRLSPRPGSRATHSSSRTYIWGGSRVSEKHKRWTQHHAVDKHTHIVLEAVSDASHDARGGGGTCLDRFEDRERERADHYVRLVRTLPFQIYPSHVLNIELHDGSVSPPPGVAGGRKAKKGKGKSKGKVRSRVTRTRDEAGFSARLDPWLLAQYCWFLDFGSAGALLEQTVAFWTRESNAVATMSVFKVSSLSMSSVRNHVVSCLESCVPSQSKPSPWSR
jgi:hypothetical protein